MERATWNGLFNCLLRWLSREISFVRDLNDFNHLNSFRAYSWVFTNMYILLLDVASDTIIQWTGKYNDLSDPGFIKF